MCACAALFSRLHPNIVFTVSRDESCRINVTTGDVVQFEDFDKGSYHRAHASALSKDETRFFIGAHNHKTVSAYDTITMQLVWRSHVENAVSCIALYQDLLIACVESSHTVLMDQASGSVLRQLAPVRGCVWSAFVIQGLAVAAFATHGQIRVRRRMSRGDDLVD